MRKALVILGLSMFFLGCLSQGGSDSSSHVKEFRIGLANFYFDPAAITVNKGDVVRLTVVNDFGEHNLFIDGYNLSTKISPEGNVQVLEFTADRSGEFKIWCEVRDHRERGMVGRLTVN